MERSVVRVGVVLAFCACLVVSMRPGQAAPGDPGVRTVTLEEAVASADRAPEMIAARAGEQAAEAAGPVARALPDPELSRATNSINAREPGSGLLPVPRPAPG